MHYEKFYLLFLIHSHVHIKPTAKPISPVVVNTKPVDNLINTRTTTSFQARINGSVRDIKTQEPLEVLVKLEKINGKIRIDSAQTSIGQFAMVPLLSTDEEYQLTAEYDGYFPVYINFNYQDYLADSTKIYDLEMSPVEKGAAVVFKHLNFSPGTAVLYAESQPYLEDLVDFMKSNPNVKIEISGHVDGTYALNSDNTFLQNLSDSRAKTIRDYLLDAGIDPVRVLAKGYSFSRMLYKPATTEEEMRANRRVEIEILEN